MNYPEKRPILLVFAFLMIINGLNSQDIPRQAANQPLIDYLAKQELDLSSYQWDDSQLNGYIRQIRRKKTSSDIFKGIGFGILTMSAVVLSEVAKPQDELLFDKEVIIFSSLGIAAVSLPFFAIGGNKKIKLKQNLAKAKDRYRELQNITHY